MATCHNHPNTKLEKLTKKLSACPICGRVRVRKMNKFLDKLTERKAHAAEDARTKGSR